MRTPSSIHQRMMPLGTLLGVVCVQATAGPVIAPGWGAPVFQDNFDTNRVDESVWQIANWPGNNNNESQYYHPAQVSVSNGSLHLRADQDPAWSFGRQYNSGLIRTWQEWSHGRFEVRARVPYGQGFWPAIWLLPRGASWPAGGEIDIMEARGDLPWRISSALHWGWDVNAHQYVSQAYESGANFQQGYHDYAVEWEPGTVRFYVDGVEHFTLFEPAVGIPSTPKSIVLNLAVGGDYSGYPDATTPFPATFDVDYVRVWQRSDPIDPPVSLVRDPGFEDSDGAMTDWERFGNTIENVASRWGTPRDGERSLKLYGQFDGAQNYSGAFQNIGVRPGDRFTASAHALIRSEDSISSTENFAVMKVEFYSRPGAEYDSEFFLGEDQIVLADAGSPQDTWSRSVLEGTAPGGAVEARLTLLFQQGETNPGGAVFIDSVSFDTTPCPSDINGDGLLNFFDVSAFLTAYNRAEPTADVNGDGALDFFDVSIFIANYHAGCP